MALYCYTLVIKTVLFRRMKRVKFLFLGLFWSFLIFFSRNLLFQLADLWLLLGSFAIGLFLILLPYKEWRWLALLAVALPLADFPSVYLLSALPMMLGYLMVLNYRLWWTYALLLVLPAALVGTWIINLNRYSVNLSFKESFQLDIVDIDSKEAIALDPDSSYFINYWHIGCSACISQERSLISFKKKKSEPDFKVLSVFLGDTSDWRFNPTRILYHSNFQNGLDRNRSVQGLLGQEIGPLLLFYHRGKAVRLWCGYEDGPLKGSFLRWYWESLLED